MLSGWQLKVSKLFIIPQRYVLGIMGFLAIVMAYTMRVILSIAIVQMVSKNNTGEHTDTSCPAPEVTGNSTASNGEYEWSEATQGLILSSFFWGYVITHMPGGILAEKFGGKHTLGLGILSTAIFTLLTPLAVHEGGATLLLVLRFLEGLGEGTTYPAVNALLAQWTPVDERGKLGSLVFAGSQIGTILGTALGGALLDAYDWPIIFYVFGVLGIIWWLLWDLLCYNDPASHPWISDKEKKYLEDNLGGKRGDDLPATPYRHILSSAPLWALIFAQIGHDWGFFTMVTDLPKYMNDVLRFDIKSNGIWSSLPYAVMWLTSIFSGWLCDLMIKKNILNITNARKIFTTIASVGPAIFIIGASYADCDKYAVVAMFTIGMGLMGAFYPGMKVNALDLAPNYAGTLMAIVNGIGAISGIITPYLVGILTPNHTLLEWRTVFWIAFGVFLFTNVIFVMFASGEVQWWNDVRNGKNIHSGNLEAVAKPVTDLDAIDDSTSKY